MKVFHVREFANLDDVADWIQFYKIRTEQIVDAYKDGDRACLTYWIEEGE